MTSTGNTLAKSQILGSVRASVPRSTIIAQGRQAITESRGRYRVHNFSKTIKHKQKHRNRRISAQNVKDVIKFTPITVSLPGNAVLRHNCTQKFHLARNPRIPNVFPDLKSSGLNKCHMFTWNHNIRNTFISQIMTHPIGVGNSLSTRPVYNAKWMQVLYQYHAAAPPFVCVTLVRIGRSANVREFSLLVRNPSVASAISMVSHFWNICRLMSSPEVLSSTKHLGFADYGRGGTSACSCAVKQHYQVTEHWWV